MKNARSWHVSGTNLEQAKSHNRRVVIETLRAFGAMTRADITRLTALTAQTVSNIVAELTRDGWLHETKSPQQVRGTSVATYDINPKGGYSIGIELVNGYALGVLCDLSGKVIDRIDIPTVTPSQQQALEISKSFVEDLTRRNPHIAKTTLGVGFSFPGRYNGDRVSYINDEQYPGWRGFPIGKALTDSIGMPVFVENDAAAAAVNERIYGCAKNTPNFALLYLAANGGIGASMFLGGQFYRGHNGNAGEVGYFDVSRKGRTVTFDELFDLPSLYKSIKIPNSKIVTEDVLIQAINEHPEAVAAWTTKAAPALTRLVEFFELALDPEMIVIGGTLIQPLVDGLVGALHTMRTESEVPLHERARIVSGTCGRNAAVLGAAALPVFSETNTQFQVLQKPHETD